MRYIIPTPITDSMLVSSSVPEADYAAWSAAATYVVGDRVIRTSTHGVYERLVPGTSATPPEVDADHWVRIGPTNRWAMLDGSVGTATVAASEISVTVRPGIVRGLALMDMDVEGVTITMRVSGRVVYERALPPSAHQEDVDSWYDYFFSTIVRRRMAVITDLPPYSEGEITITATGDGVAIGSCVVGALQDLGTLLASPRVSITDYSKKAVDDYGVVTVAERGFSKRVAAEVALPTSHVDVATARLSRVRAQPVVWIGSASFESLVVYGFVKDWSVAIPGLTTSTCSLEIEGLV